MVKKCLVSKLPFLKDKVVIIKNGINVDFFKAKYDASLRMRERIILCVGTLSRVKDQFTLIKALVLVDKAKLWLVGDGPTKKDVMNLIEQLGLQDRVLLLGKRVDVHDLLDKAVLYVQPSLFEGFGIAMLEAMASGVPVIGSNGAGMLELLKDVGMTFTVGDEKELACNINLLLNDSKLLNHMSVKGKNKADEYSIATTVDEYLRLYKMVIGI